MQVSRKNQSDTEILLTIVASESELAKIKKHTLEHLAAKVRLPGFRDGKAPLNLVEKNVDSAELQQAFLEEALGSLYAQVSGEEKLRAVAEPQIEIKKFVPFTALEFAATVSVVSEVRLPDYKKIRVPQEKVTVGTDEVNDVVVSLQKRIASRVKVDDRAAKNGDEVIIDFTGTDSKGAVINGAEAKDYPLVIGSSAFIPGFEDNVIGMKTGEEKQFVLTFPKDYGVKALANKKVTFTVTLRGINEMQLPKLDDAFATQASPFKTLKELKDDIKKQLAIEKQNRADRDFESDLVKAITAKSKVSVPKVLIDDTVERLIQEVKQNLVYRGMTYQEFLDSEGKTDAEYRAELAPNAEDRVKASLVLAEIAEVEKLDVTLEELEVRIQHLKGQYSDAAMQAELEKPENRRDIASRVLTEKVLDKLKTYARA